MTQKPFALVLMPFSPDFDDVYKLGIQECCREHDVVAERVDEQLYSETMIERIYRQIEAADFIIADMTGKNPNVFYEVGYAHAKGKICTLLTQDSADIPFDLKHHRHLVYGGKITQLKKQLAPELQWLKAEILKRRTSPFTLKVQPDGELIKTDDDAHAQLTLKIDLFNQTDRKTPDLEAIYLRTGRPWTFTQNGDQCPFSNIEENGKKLRQHFIKPPVVRLQPGGWAQFALRGSKRVWSRYLGEGPVKDSYRVNGYLYFDLVTSEGVIPEKLLIDFAVEDFPF